MLSSNTLVAADISTIVIPSEPHAAGRTASISGLPVAAPAHRRASPPLSSPLRPLFLPPRPAVSGVSKPGTACPGTQLPLVSVTAVRKAVLPELNPAGITVGSTFNKCSYGKSTFNAANSQVADLVQLPCKGLT